MRGALSVMGCVFFGRTGTPLNSISSAARLTRRGKGGSPAACRALRVATVTLFSACPDFPDDPFFFFLVCEPGYK